MNNDLFTTEYLLFYISPLPHRFIKKILDTPLNTLCTYLYIIPILKSLLVIVHTHTRSLRRPITHTHTCNNIINYNVMHTYDSLSTEWSCDSCAVCACLLFAVSRRVYCVDAYITAVVRHQTSAQSRKKSNNFQRSSIIFITKIMQHVMLFFQRFCFVFRRSNIKYKSS